MDVHTTAGLADGDLRSEGDGDAVFVAQLAHHPFGNDQLVGSRLEVGRQELYLVLLIHQIAVGEVAHLAVAILDFATGRGDHAHSFGAELLELAVGHTHVVAMLVLRHVLVLSGSNGVVFQLAHHLEFHTTCGLAESTGGLLKRILGSHSEGLAVLVEEGAEKVEGRHLGEGIEEGGAEPGDNIEVRVAGFDVGEEAGTIHALTAGKHLVDMGQALDDEVEGVEFAIVGHVAEIDHFHLELLNHFEDVGLGEFLLGLLEEGNQRVGIEFYLVLRHDICGFIYKVV